MRKCSLPFAAIALAFLTLLFSCTTEDTSEILVSVSAPAEPSDTYPYLPGDIVRWRAELTNTSTTETAFVPSEDLGDGRVRLLLAGMDERLSTGEVRQGKYVVRAYGYDAAGTPIAYSGSGDAPRFLVETDYGETKSVTVPLHWGALQGDFNKQVRFWDADAGERIGSTVTVWSGSTVDAAKIPAREGYELECYRDSARTVPFDFTQPITYSVTVWCRWTRAYDAGLGVTVTIDTTTGDLALTYELSGTAVTFAVTDAGGTVVWYVDGEKQTETGATLTLETAGLDAGAYEVRAVVGARSATAVVRIGDGA